MLLCGIFMDFTVGLLEQNLTMEKRGRNVWKHSQVGETPDSHENVLFIPRRLMMCSGCIYLFFLSSQKGGGALISTVKTKANPAVRSAYQYVRHLGD